ncbi:AMP-binding protein [Noviherbaspirillum denitrificans]|uniref:Long-chain-fatty-acid--CoA ligase n=1 Tax=Noviherbaspirillum denitrificans TaxID=1968433 RepID=A0A254TAK6_9BURK|nr:AMP-binding protein [Noviherbaspirillum denitrificans]OWW18322.1 long-chain fatty acid--CoA ligase [Noviherbaspirillum denitrificans]
MEKIWLKEYAPGVPSEIDVNAHTSIIGLMEKCTAQYGPLNAFECSGVKLTYSQLDVLTRHFASYLSNTLGLARGDRVAIMLPNLVQYPVAMFGILRAGMVVVNVNPLYTPRELEYQLQDSGARAIVLLGNLCDAHKDVLDRNGLEAIITTTLDGSGILPENLDEPGNNGIMSSRKLTLPDALAKGRKAPFTPTVLTHGDNAFLQYTGGTTGLSKGAELTHGSITANLTQLRVWASDVIREGQECFITMIPLYHIMALTGSCLLSICSGANNVLFTNPKDMDGTIAELKKHRFSVMPGVNTLFNGLLNHPAIGEVDFSGLKLTIGGGASVQQVVAERWKKLTGNHLTEVYGLTEASPGVSFAPLDKPQWNGTIGLPLPSTLVSLRDDDNKEVPIGSPGELCIKGPQVMRGYWNKPAETANAFTPDGYLRTGDVAVMNERGYIRLVDRKKDMILVSGFNVYPTEIESVVAMHEGIFECACIGVPDEQSGEVPKVYAVRKDQGLTIGALQEHCKKHLAGYKVPRHFEFIEQLPKSNVGKILRRELRNS